jgi:D-alanyl-D-alanine carboxypeptidase/D-alanyl-D-alanine-endopeptidase (penicillin-binding protein 4)
VSLLKEVFARRGIAVKGRARTADWKYREITPIALTKLFEIASVESLPVKDIVRETLKPSQNLWAQLLLLQVGATAVRANTVASRAGEAEKGSSPAVRAVLPQDSSSEFATTEEIGIAEMNAFLAQAGVKKGEVLLEEGSGLSRKDIITPGATVELLKFMSRHRWAQAYRDALPIAGVDGTLEKRMKATPAENNVRAKTGSLQYVHALSGYVTTAAGERLAFSIMINNSYNRERGSSPRDDIDAIAIMLAGFTGRSEKLESAKQ